MKTSAILSQNPVLFLYRDCEKLYSISCVGTDLYRRFNLVDLTSNTSI